MQPPGISLGTMIAAGSKSAVTHPWLFLLPSILLILIMLVLDHPVSKKIKTGRL